VQTLNSWSPLGLSRDQLPIATGPAYTWAEDFTMTPQTYVQEKAAASGSSFYYAFLFLPAPRRAAITAFYAFCREVDDVVDETRDLGVAQTKLAWWRQEVAQAFDGTPNHPVTQALMPHTSEFGIEARHLLAVIDGCQMDLDQNRYLDFSNLQTYCHLVAGVVGEVAARIFGQTQPETTAFAHKLGLAFQLTNIIRDVGEDATRGRIYLPINDLQRFDVKAYELLKRGAAPGTTSADFEKRFEALMGFQCTRALQTYDEALSMLPEPDRRAQKPGLMMASIYRTLLHEIAEDPLLVLTQRVSLTPLRKFWLAWKVQALGRL
jgi:15-cis-phytoene synthase